MGNHSILRLLSVVVLWSSLPHQVRRVAGTVTNTASKDTEGVNDKALRHSSNQRHLDTDDGEENPYVYSKMSAMVPDPLLANLTAEEKSALEEKFGRWRFWDGEEKNRPKEDALAKFPDRDMPGEDMPEDMWQADAVFVNHLLNDADKLLTRALEAIFSDFGRGRPLPPEGYTQRRAQFRMERLDLKTQTSPPPDYVPRTGPRNKGGWTTEQSNQGLVRRLLHAIQTNDEFVVVLGGDAAAAGHGNHFRQAYLMEFHRIVAPVLARMGVKLVTRNGSVGHGLGTFQSSLGFSSLYGQDIDVLIWDCAMTEKESKYADLFFRQGLMSQKKTNKVPHLFVGGNSNGEGLFQLLRWFHNEADINVAQLGTATFSVPVTESVDHAKTIPKALQFINCTSDAHEACQANMHCTHCWIDRKDIPDPKSLFADLGMSEKDKAEATTVSMDGTGDNTQRFWYPGWRQHLLLGRNLAHVILDATREAIDIFSSGTMGGPPLEDDDWHVTELYKNMRTKLKTLLAQTDGDDAKQCYAFATEAGLPSRICNVPMQGATQHTPRPFPNETAISALFATEDNSKIPSNPEMMQYQGQDVHNECMDFHDVDVAQVVGLRRRHLKGQASHITAETTDDTRDITDDEGGMYSVMPSRFREVHQARRHRDEVERILRKRRSLPESTIALGSGWQIKAEKPGLCDGEYISICGREARNVCPLLGHHDSRGEIVGNEACGWLVLNLPSVKEGIVVVKISFYSTPETSSNRALLSSDEDRKLSASSIPTNDDFRFEFSTDGAEVTSWDKTQVAEKIKTINRKTEIITLLDGTMAGDEAKAMQVAMRVKGCGASCRFAISHVYWA